MMHRPSKATLIVKVVNVGDHRVGKTSLAIRYTQNRFGTSYIPTLGVDFHSKIVQIDEDTTIKLVLFDTVGHEGLTSLRKRYYTGAHGAVVVYDVTNRESFEHVKDWIEEVTDRCPNIEIVILGNKIDLEDQRQVTLDEAKKKWEPKGYMVLESSAKWGQGVEDVYTIIAKKVIQKEQNDLQ